MIKKNIKPYLPFYSVQKVNLTCKVRKLDVAFFMCQKSRVLHNTKNALRAPDGGRMMWRWYSSIISFRCS